MRNKFLQDLSTDIPELLSNLDNFDQNTLIVNKNEISIVTFA